jgi:hypothetical protein
VIPRRLNGKGRARPRKARRLVEFRRRIIDLAKTSEKWQLSDEKAKNVLNNDANFELSGFRTVDKFFVAAHKPLIHNDFIDLDSIVGYGYD